MKTIKFENKLGQSITFTNSAPYMFDDITTIHNVDNHSYKGAGQDGSHYLGNTLDERDVSIKTYLIGRDKGHYDRLKTKLYQVFNPKLGEGHLIYTDDHKTRKINCVVDKVPFLVEMNNRTGKVNIDLLSNEGFWKDINEQKEEIALWVGDFEFPLEMLETGIEMGHREPSLIVNCFNDGDVESGMRIEFKALATLTNPSLFNVNTREFMKINKEMVAGEIIAVTTYFANKRITSRKHNIETNAFNYIDQESTFLQLDQGDNLFRYNADSGIDNLEVSIYHYDRYLGV